MSEKAITKLNQELTNIFTPEIATIPAGAVRYENDWKFQWENKLAIHRVYQLSLLFNRKPDYINTNKGGMALWQHVKAKASAGHYVKIEVFDNNILHFKPVPHSDFMHVTTTMDLKPETIERLSKLTTSVYYYPEGREITAVCGEMGANIITFAVVKMLDIGWINMSSARVTYDRLIERFLEKEFLPAEKVSDMWMQPMPIRDACERFVMNETHEKARQLLVNQ